MLSVSLNKTFTFFLPTNIFIIILLQRQLLKQFMKVIHFINCNQLKENNSYFNGSYQNATRASYYNKQFSNLNNCIVPNRTKSDAVFVFLVNWYILVFHLIYIFLPISFSR